MENILDAGYKLPESIKKELIEEGIDISNIELCTFIEEDKQSHLWYGGDVVKFNYKDAIIYIAAIGDVIISFKDKNDDLLFYVKDKCNRGNIYQDLSHYVENDEELLKILLEEHPKYQFGSFDSKNWWEAYVVYDGKIYDLMWDLDAYTITEAIIETYKERDRIYSLLMENVKNY